MKKLNAKWTLRLTALGLAATCLGAGAALAAGGDQSDPLVTLSYLEQTAIPQVVKQAEDKTAVRQQELEQSFQAQIDRYKQEASQAGASGVAGYTLVTMSKDQVMTLEVGCELLLRVGNATVKSGGNPALIDLSVGGTVNSGASLVKNHLYMATISDRTVTATAGTVKLLVRGGYTVA